MLCYCSVFLVAILIAFYFSRTQRQRPIFNIYQKPTCFYWPKVLFMYCIISLRQWSQKKNPKKIPTPEELDQPHALSFHEKAIDAVYFNASNSHGDYLVAAIARRKEKLMDTFLILKIADSELGVLVIPKLPDTSLYKLEENEDYSVEGLTITPSVPMKIWKITYKGKMKKANDFSKFYDVEINMDWTSDMPYFNFDTDTDPLLTAKYLALEPWSAEFFKNLQDIHQTHYEQFGKFNGTVLVNGQTYTISMDSARDHSFGKQRHWDMIHRYALHYFSTEDGGRFAVLKICMPIIGSDITLGYVYCTNDKKYYPLQTCDLSLYQHGEGGTPPKDYAFSFTANNQHYTMQVNVHDSPAFYISKQWEGKVWEMLCTSTVNGVKGWGIAEWEQRNVAGRAIESSL